MGEESEPRTQAKQFATLRVLTAEHLGGRMASGALREMSRFLTRMATWFSCVDGHVILLVVARTVSFPEDSPPILPVSRCAINQPCVDVQEMNPYFVVATLVGRFDSKNFMRNFKRTVQANMPLGLGTPWLDETAHIRPYSSPSRHNAVGPCGMGKFVLANANLIDVAKRHH